MMEMDELIKLFGDYKITGVTVATLCTCIAAIVFLVKVYRKVRDYLITTYKAREAKDKMISDTFEEVKKYQELRTGDRQQSLEIQKDLADSIALLKQSNEELQRHLKELSERTKKYELADTRDKLLQSYRYYTSAIKNPRGAWTELEKEAFFELFGSYEDSGGNGFMHTTVQPEMNKLIVVLMNQSEEISNLMHSRC
jgi:hypothetical protein